MPFSSSTSVWIWSTSTWRICGPTVYSYVHIGNGRPAVVFDVLTRLLRTRYPQVSYVSNITDIDDKIIQAALERSCGIETVSEEFTAKYREDMAALGALRWLVAAGWLRGLPLPRY